MKFTKMQGAGNDFIIINNYEEKFSIEQLSKIAKRLCTRRLSVGADGLMAIDKPLSEGDYRMMFFNSDGSLGEMCGNGARCICRYGYDHGLTGDTQKIETTAGIVTGIRIDERTYRVKLNNPTYIDLHRSICVNGVTYDCTYLELGNPGLPHCIVPLSDFDEMSESSLRELGRSIRYYESFPKGANVTFVKLVEDNHLKAITYERGVEDFTLACGTGCGSTVSAMALRGLVTGNNVNISMPGGELFVTVTIEAQNAHDIYLTGPTNVVCYGEISDEELKV